MKKVGGQLFVIFTMLLALTSVKLVPLVSANTRVPGVAPGQFLHYAYNISSSGNDTELLTRRPTTQEWLNITVLDGSGVSVTYRQVVYNATDIQSDNTFLHDVETGYTQLVSGPGGLQENFLVAANLSAGDPIYLQASAPTINETIITSYLGSQFETNYLTVHTTTNNASYFGLTVNVSMTEQWYWERRTGVSLDIYADYEFSRSDGAGGVLTAHAQARILILSAVPPPPVIPEFPSFVILPSFMAVTLLAVFVFRRKHVPPSRE